MYEPAVAPVTMHVVPALATNEGGQGGLLPGGGAVTVQVALPEGAGAPATPVTDTVIVKFPPGWGFFGNQVTLMVGVAFDTVNGGWSVPWLPPT